MRRFASLLFAAAVAAASAAEPSARVVLCAAGTPRAELADAWRAMGCVVRTGLEPGQGEVVAGVYCRSLAALSESDATRVAAFAESGATLWFGIAPQGLRGDPPRPLSRWLPANLWSFKSGLDRGPGSVIFHPGKTIQLGHRFDLHLPGSPIESPMSRLEPEQWLRDPSRFTRSSVRATDATTGLPLWIDADVGPARVHLLAFDPEDPLAISSPDYASFASALAAPPPSPSPSRPRPSNGDRRSAFSLSIEESESSLSDLSPSPLPREGIDGITSRRYVYRADSAPEVRIRIRNHLVNIAPIATVRDLDWPGNPSTIGLTDNAFTTASLRGTLPIHAIWTGRTGVFEHGLGFDWRRPVFVSSVRLWGFGLHRHWNRANPRDITIDSGGTAILAVTNAAFSPFPFARERAVWEVPCGGIHGEDSPRRLSRLSFRLGGVAAGANIEPRRDWPSNCALAEIEVFGWDGEPDSVNSRALSLRSIRVDLSTGSMATNVILAPTEVPFCSERVVEAKLQPLDSFGPVRWRFQVLEASRIVAEEPFDAFFIPEGGRRLEPNVPENTVMPGLLCTPGWRNADSFGLGMNAWSRGWGGAQDQIWAWENDLLETGHRVGPVPVRDDPARLFGGAMRASHYTLPWKRLPNGQDAFRLVSAAFLDRLATGDWHRQGKTELHLGGSDRWNGVPAGMCFTWDHFVRFDKWLRSQGRGGLRARSRAAITREIREEFGELWQQWLLREYANLHLGIRRDFAAKGLGYTYETHGSFPLAGGELGADLAKTHRGVGTDLFWELQRQDLWFSLGRRIAVVAANPDLRSGAYDEWGWVNSEQNKWWFGSNSGVAPARRQWYATYFLGRVDLSGAFHPYHETGFSSQGSHGPRYTAADHGARCRVHNLVTQLRPEEPAGFGLVVSWRGQERRMGPRLGRAGFGLHPADGETDVVEMCASVYAALAKAGVPISFVTSTHALRNWRGSNPLILIDAPNWEDWEWEAARAAKARGAFLAPISSPSSFSDADALTLAPRIADALGHPLDLRRGIVAVPFVSHGRLFLSLCRQNDDDGPVTVTINPSVIAPTVSNQKPPPRGVAVLDDGIRLPVEHLPDGRVRFSVVIGPADGRIVMLTP